MDDVKKLASDSTKTSVSSEEKKLASDKSPSAEIPIPSLPTKVTTQVETGSCKERIRKATLEGGLKDIPDGFDDRDGDWAIIKSENPFEVLYLDYNQYMVITPEMVKNNFEILSDFWDGKIHQMMSSSATKTQIIQKYGGEQGTEKTIQNYKRLLEHAYKQLQSGIEKCYLEIDAKRLEIGRQHLQQTIEAILSDGIYMPDEKDTVLKYGWKVNLRDDEILELLIKELDVNGFYPYEKIKDGATNSEKVSVVWVTKEKVEEYEKGHREGKKGALAQQDSLTILESDFVAATKRDKTLNSNTANFLYDKGADLGVDNSNVIDLIKRWGNQYRVDIKDGIPNVEIDKTSFELLGVEFHSTASRSFTVSNTGAGTLSGTIKDLTTSNKPWLKVEQKNIDTQNEQEISFKVDTAVLDYGDKDTGKIEIQSNGGTANIEVKISIQEATEYIKRFRNKLTAATFLLGGLFGYFIYSLNFVDGMNTYFIALIGSIILLFTRKTGIGWGIVLFIAVLIAIPQLAKYSPHGLSTVAWALTYGAIADISAKSIWKARRRGDKKIPIAIGVGVLILTVGIIIGGMLMTAEENKSKAVRNEARERVVQDIVSKLPGKWHGKVGNKAATLFITKAGGQLSGKMIYEGVEERLSIDVQFEKNNPVVILKGVSYKRLKGRGSFSLDTFYGILSNDSHSITGNYKDTAGNKGKWSVSRVSESSNSNALSEVSLIESSPQDSTSLFSSIRTPPTPESWTIAGDQLFTSAGEPLHQDIAKLIAALESRSGEGTPVSKQEFMDMLSKPEAQTIYYDEIMKYATPASLAIQKKEHKDYTEIFMREHYQKAGVEFLRTQREYLERAEREYGVLQRDIVSVLIWESGLGKFTGDYRVFNVFLGQILFLDQAQETAVRNLIAEGKPNPLDDPAHAQKEQTRLQKRKASAINNMAALLRVCKKAGINPFDMKGSWGGAIGNVQFMPANLKYAVDGDRDGKLNLAQWPDAIMSVGNFLKIVGKYEPTNAGRGRALLKYNPSKEFADGVMMVAETVWNRHLNGE